MPKGHYPRQSLAERFWSKVYQVPFSECMYWGGPTFSETGYGAISIGSRKVATTRGAHRVSWEMAFGPIPQGQQVRHLCDRRYPVGDISYRLCVNPSHLALGTHADNMRDMVDSGRVCKGDRAWMRKYPERVKRGLSHYMSQHPERVPRGSAHPQSKLNEAAVREIRASSEPRPVLAARYGVSLPTIGQVITRRVWKHV